MSWKVGDVNVRTEMQYESGRRSPFTEDNNKRWMARGERPYRVVRITEETIRVFDTDNIAVQSA